MGHECFLEIKIKKKQKMREGKEYILVDVRGIFSFNTFVIFIPAFIEEKQT